MEDNKICREPNFPKNIQILNLIKYGSELNLETLPKSIWNLKWRQLPNTIIFGDVPENITHLTIGRLYSGIKLHDKITHFRYSNTFCSQTYDLSLIPKNIVHLTFGDSFDDSIDKRNSRKYYTSNFWI